MSAEELKSDVMVTSICRNAAFLHVPFQHIHTSKYRKNCLKKTQNHKLKPLQISADVAHQTILQYYFPSSVWFISSLCFYGFPKLWADTEAADPVPCHPHPLPAQQIYLLNSWSKLSWLWPVATGQTCSGFEAASETLQRQDHGIPHPEVRLVQTLATTRNNSGSTTSKLN